MNMQNTSTFGKYVNINLPVRTASYSMLYQLDNTNCETPSQQTDLADLLISMVIFKSIPNHCLEATDFFASRLNNQQSLGNQQLTIHTLYSRTNEWYFMLICNIKCWPTAFMRHSSCCTFTTLES
jgi:hypothetical protein